MNGLCLGSGRSLPFLRLTDRKLQPGYILHASHLKDTVEAAVVNLVLADPVLRRAIVTNQSVGSLSNPRLKIGIRLLRGLFSKGTVTLDKGASAFSILPRS
jgi:hypothetical protein